MKFVRVLLQSVGALTLLLLCALAVRIVLSASGAKKVTDKDDAKFVLNWGGLDPNQDWTIIDGSVSPRNITGDHTDYFCIQLQDIAIDPQLQPEWQAGPENSGMLAETLESAVEWAQFEGAKCFPPIELANSPQMQILFWGMRTHGRSPAGAQVLLLQPATKRLFYVSFDT